MSKKTAALSLAAVLLCCMDAWAGTAALRPDAAGANLVLRADALPRRSNGRVDSNALFARIAASRAVDVPVLARLDRYKVNALVLAVARNDSAAVERGLRELIELIRALPASDMAEADVSELMLLICKAAAIEAYAGLADLMNEMNARRHLKEQARPADDELALLQARLILCDLKRPCAPPDGKTLQAAGLPPEMLRAGADPRARRVETLAAAIAMITAHAERMDALAKSILHNVKS